MATSALPLTTQDAPAPAPPPRFVPFEDPAAVQAATERYLVGDEISSRAGAGGQSVHYVECWRAIQAANRIFGFNGWSSDIVSLEKEFMGPEKDGKWVAMYSAVVRVELKDGTSHTETGSGDAKDRDRAKAVENARKEAVSDATKRALRAFGNALGNCVYDKAHCKENEAAKKAAAKRPALAAAPQPQPPQFQQQPAPQQWQQQPPPGAALAGKRPAGAADAPAMPPGPPAQRPMGAPPPPGVAALPQYQQQPPPQPQQGYPQQFQQMGQQQQAQLQQLQQQRPGPPPPAAGGGVPPPLQSGSSLQRL